MKEKPFMDQALTGADVGVVVVAAGRGSRSGLAGPKQYHALAGRTLLEHTMGALLDHPGIGAAVCVIHAEDSQAYAEATAHLSHPALRAPVTGGATRQASVLAGLEALAGSCRYVLIHDAARPFVSRVLLDRLIERLGEGDVVGAVPALPVVDTLKRANTANRIEATLPRDGLWRAQTPQAFRLTNILQAHREAAGQALTDDAAVAEAAGLAVALVTGDEENIKLTHAADFEAAAARLEASSMTPSPDLMAVSGQGFDVHRFEAGDHVWLCGVKVPHSAGLKGHSDADVGLHALTDAILGAIAAGDIGDHFPPSDPKWRGAPSDRFLAHALNLVTTAGGQLAHVDVTLICEAPRIGPHKQAMRARIAALTGLDVRRVSVKATTTEKLGFTGRGEGIAAQASATVLVPMPAGSGCL